MLQSYAGPRDLQDEITQRRFVRLTKIIYATEFVVGKNETI